PKGAKQIPHPMGRGWPEAGRGDQVRHISLVVVPSCAHDSTENLLAESARLCFTWRGTTADKTVKSSKNTDRRPTGHPAPYQDALALRTQQPYRFLIYYEI